MLVSPAFTLLVTGDFVQTGGMDVANYALARYLADAGSEVHVVAFRVAEPLASHPRVTWHRVPKPLRSYTLALPLLDHHGRRVARRLAKRGGRVVVNGGSCWWADVNWVHYVHAAHRPQTSAGSLRRWVSRYNHTRWLREERRALLDAQIVVVNSERTRRDVVDRLGVSDERVHTVYYGIDPERFQPATPGERVALRESFGWARDRPMVIFVGNMGDHRKGFDTLFAAWTRNCADPTWDADLAVIGAGAELPLWRERAREVGLSERVRFFGFRADVHDLLRAADLLVSPTRYEAYGLGVHEALCCGLPALVSADAGVAERYPENLRGLLLSKPDDADELNAKLLEWRDNLDGCQTDVLPVSAQLRKWTWDRMAEQFVSVMQNPG